MSCKLDECMCRKENVPLRMRVLCKHWYPSQGSKYFNCELYELQKEPCPFEDSDGTSPCETCEYYAKLESKGRPNVTGVDWNNPESVNEYRRMKYRAKRNGHDV